MRRKNDFYPTPEFATEILMKHVPIKGSVLECCSGDGQIAEVVNRRVGVDMYENDIDPQWGSQWTFDASRDWPLGIGRHSWVVTNPPFNCAADIVPRAYGHAINGIAMLLRLSYLEPVENRGAWLNEHPPTTLIVLPRISFTGDGKTDNVTCAWMVWDKEVVGQRIMVAENPRFAPANGGIKPFTEKEFFAA